MSDIFVSYARVDRARAAALAAALEARGWTVWWDCRIRTGEVFDEVIETALSEASCVVVLWSAASVKRRWVKVEARLAEERGIPLLPALIELYPRGGPDQMAG